MFLTFIALYFHLTIPQTLCFTVDVKCNVAKASKDTPVNILLRGMVPFNMLKLHMPAVLSEWENTKIIIDTACLWFTLNVCVDSIFSTLFETDPPYLTFYGLGLNSSSIWLASTLVAPLDPRHPLIMFTSSAGCCLWQRWAMLILVCWAMLILVCWANIPLQHSVIQTPALWQGSVVGPLALHSGLQP